MISRQNSYAGLLLAAFLIMGWTSTHAQERYETSAGDSQKTITAVITWRKDFVTTPDENNPARPAENPCWPFSISVHNATDPGDFYHTEGGASAFTVVTSVQPRYKLQGDMHVCTFEFTGPVGVPLEIEPSVRNIRWLSAQPVPSTFVPPGGNGSITLRYTRGFTPSRKSWTLDKHGVYLRFKYEMVTW